MPVNSTHPDYDAYAEAWSRARDVLAGEDAVKAGGIRYLPRLRSQNEEEYAAYKQRTSFFNATARTAEAYVGLIFRRPLFVKSPAVQGRKSFGVEGAFSSFLPDVDLLGTALNAYAKNVVNEVVAVGRAGTLLDFESETEKRAFVKLYKAEQILNWRVERVNGRAVPTMIVLQETVNAPAINPDTGEPDPFLLTSRTQIRVLSLVPSSTLTREGERPRETLNENPLSSNSGGEGRGEEVFSKTINHQLQTTNSATQYACRADLYQQFKTTDDKEEWRLVDTHIPRRKGRPLPLIPFVFHGARHSLPEIEKLPLADIIAVNLDHYRLDAEYKHGIHFTALPTAWVSGFDKSATLRIGSSTAWVTDTIGAAAGYLEFTGQGLMTFERAMDRDEKLLAVLGSRLLEGQKKVGEAAQAIELRQSGENSILSNLSNSVSQSLTEILRWIYWWHSGEENPDDIGDDKVLVELNTDFSTTGMDPQELTAVVAAWQAGAISRDTMTDLFRRGEVLPEGRTAEEEVRAIHTQKEAGSGTTPLTSGPQNRKRNPQGDAFLTRKTSSTPSSE
jgi:hypothetical protein